MYKYIRCYEQGFISAVKSAYVDIIENNIKYYSKIIDDDIKSKLYDIGYINGYINTIKNFPFKK